MMNKKMLSIVVTALAVIAIAAIMKGSGLVKPSPDNFTYERDTLVDQGVILDPTNVVSTDNNRVRLSEVFSAERTANYGGYATSGKPSGGELKVTFAWKSDGKVTRTETFVIDEDKTEADNYLRNKYVAEKRTEFDRFISDFTAPIGIKRAFGLALDVTEGMTPEFAKRVKEVIDDTRAVQLGSDTKNTVTLNLYNITQNPYQGGRQRPNLGSAAELGASLEWLLKERKAEAQSSVLRGLVAILTEMAEFKDARPRLDIFTDGLENLSELSVYKHPELLNDEAGWSKLDQIADLKTLGLSSLEIHLHPLPAKSSQHAKMMERGLIYLADRLTKAGAAVKIEPL